MRVPSRLSELHGFDNLNVVVVPSSSTLLLSPSDLPVENDNNDDDDDTGLLRTVQEEGDENDLMEPRQPKQLCWVCPFGQDTCQGENLCTDCDDRYHDGRIDKRMINFMSRTCPSCDCTRAYSMCEIARHNTEESAWLVVGNDVFDVTRILHQHPGGKESILRKSGGVVDCTKDFLFHSHQGRKLWRSCYIGRVQKCTIPKKQDGEGSDGSSFRLHLHGRLEDFFRGIMLRIHRDTDP
jgi:Cytochrome b5-like Heme/Steroid binding domain